MENNELTAIQNEMSKFTDGGRDRSAAVELAHAYVESHPDEFVDIRNKTLEENVAAVDLFRQAGWEEAQWRVETWLLHTLPEPPHIGGDAVINLNNLGG